MLVTGLFQIHHQLADFTLRKSASNLTAPTTWLLDPWCHTAHRPWVPLWCGWRPLDRLRDTPSQHQLDKVGLSEVVGLICMWGAPTSAWFDRLVVPSSTHTS